MGGTKSFRTLLYNLCERDKELYFHASSDSDRERIHGGAPKNKLFYLINSKIKMEKEVVTTNSKEEFVDPFESEAPASPTTPKVIGATCESCEG